MGNPPPPVIVNLVKTRLSENQIRRAGDKNLKLPQVPLTSGMAPAKICGVATCFPVEPNGARPLMIADRNVDRGVLLRRHRDQAFDNFKHLPAPSNELAKLIADHNWAETSVGPASGWPQSLKTAVGIMLTSRQPIWIGWGGELTYFYNDPYKSIIGGKHPWALGRPTAEVWKEIWSDIGPMLAQALQGSEGTYVEAQLLIMERNGYPEETYYTFSYTPIPDDNGAVGGIFCANTEDTQRVIGQRQLELLRELPARTATAKTWQEACKLSVEALATNPRDLPFAALYVLEPDGRSAKRVSFSGVAQDHPAFAANLSLKDERAWPLSRALRDRRFQHVTDIGRMFG